MPPRGILSTSLIPTPASGWPKRAAMIRPILTELAFFITPFALYAWMVVWSLGGIGGPALNAIMVRATLNNSLNDTWYVGRGSSSSPGYLSGIQAPLTIEAALFETGRPVLVVPYIQKTGVKLDRVMVCWDGSRNAARAIADALPFLKRGKVVEIVMVAGGSGKGDEIPGVDLAGLTPEKRAKVLEALNSEHCSCGCGLTVGLGHVLQLRRRPAQSGVGAQPADPGRPRTAPDHAGPSGTDAPGFRSPQKPGRSR